ncbi:MAG: LppU/SCO3897 family protein [Stackebrandtia sp.]
MTSASARRIRNVVTRTVGVAAVATVAFSATACGLLGGFDAAKGDCVTNSTDPNEIEVVGCDSEDAAYEVVHREDDPEGVDDETTSKICDEHFEEGESYNVLYDEEGTWLVCLKSV